MAFAADLHKLSSDRNHAIDRVNKLHVSNMLWGMRAATSDIVRTNHGQSFAKGTGKPAANKTEQ